MRPKLAQLLIAFTLIVSIGGHWAFLQSIGWVGMLVSYAQADTMLVALEKTFNGKNPCQICRVVKEGKQAEKDKPLLKVETKLDLWVARDPAFIHPPRPFLLGSVPALAPRLLLESPPRPPPRRA